MDNVIIPAWVWSGGVGVILLALAGLVWRDLKEKLREMASRFDKNDQWREDWEKNQYRFRTDEYQSAISDINARLYPATTHLEILVKDVEGIHGWKHEKVDPYIPAVLLEHEKRIDRLERRTYDGGNLNFPIKQG